MSGRDEERTSGGRGETFGERWLRWQQSFVLLVVLVLLSLCVIPKVYSQAYRSAMQGDLFSARLLCLVDGPNPTITDHHNLLTDAAGNGSLPVVQYLLAQGADINAGGGSSTPITEAAFRGQFEMVRYLAAQGAQYASATLYCDIGKTGGGETAGRRLVLGELPLQGDLAELRERILNDIDRNEAALRTGFHLAEYGGYFRQRWLALHPGQRYGTPPDTFVAQESQRLRAETGEELACLRDFLQRHPEVVNAPVIPGSLAEHFSRDRGTDTAALPAR